MLRTFVAVELPEQAKRAVAEAQERLRSSAHAVRWSNPAGAHVTLKFLGPTPEEAVPRIEAELGAALAATAPLRLRTAQLGGFPNERAPRVLWLGLAGDVEPLGRLRDAVERVIAPLGWPTEARAFSPHLTLGRLRQEAGHAERLAAGSALAGAEPPPPVEIEVREVSLMLSELSPRGARYSRLFAVPLTS